jgi:hypothetical protein
MFFASGRLNIELVKIVKRRYEILKVANHRQRPIAFLMMKHELYLCTGIFFTFAIS